ncbi:MAG: MFS transporter [Deltaproteobacteria bacterium]|nr:MFS transporter [Deltaproteobacteria bacterium]
MRPTPIPPPSGTRYAYYVLGVLAGINLLNYIDRQVLYALFPLIKEELDLSDLALGTLASAFMVTYLLAAPVMGVLGDRWVRSRLIAGGVFLWSVCTALSGLVRGYDELLVVRGLVGIGEVSYGTVAPAIIADYFPPARRARMLAIFYMAIPVGSALGYLLGGLIGEWLGWREAFYVVGGPGVLLALLVWRLRDPPRGGTEEGVPPRGLGQGVVRTLLGTPSYRLGVLSMTAVTFALGGLAAWLPTYFVREWDMGVAEANAAFGIVTVVAGVTGTLSGGWLGDWLLRYTRRAYSLLSGVSLLASLPFGVLGLFVIEDPRPALGTLLVAEFLIFLNSGPLNAVIANVTPARIRSTAFALNIFFIHALGDAISPSIIGHLSDGFGLRAALWLTPAAVAVGALVCLFIGRHLAEDMRRAGTLRGEET